MIRRTEKVRVIGHKVSELRPWIEHHAGRRNASCYCIGRHWNKRVCCGRRALEESCPAHGPSDQHIWIVARAIGDRSHRHAHRRAEIGQREIDCIRSRALRSGQRVLRDVDIGAAKRHPGRVDAVVHPLTREIGGLGTSDGSTAFDAIASDRASKPLEFIRRRIRAENDSLCQIKVLDTAVEYALAGGCKGHIIDEGVAAIRARDRLPK